MLHLLVVGCRKIELGHFALMRIKFIKGASLMNIISLMKKNIFLMKKYACVFFVIKEGVLNEPIFLNEKGEK